MPGKIRTGFEHGSVVWVKAGHISVIIAIGGNLAAERFGAPLQTCAWAAGQLAGLAGLGRPVRSRWYASAAEPPGSGPRYVNGVVRLDGTPEPAALLASLQRIEAQAGRTRSAPNAPRTLDLDIISLGATVRSAPDPLLPHPRAHLRAFVLLPLRDVAPDWSHPVTGRTVGDLIAALPAHDTRPVWPVPARS